MNRRLDPWPPARDETNRPRPGEPRPGHVWVAEPDPRWTLLDLTDPTRCPCSSGPCGHLAVAELRRSIYNRNGTFHPREYPYCERHLWGWLQDGAVWHWVERRILPEVAAPFHRRAGDRLVKGRGE
jgi:hypothetical protein